MPSFPDVNVWLALAAADHGHHAQAVHWLDTCSDPVIAFCRVTQAGLLRLLTNRGVMGGYPLTADGAWKVADTTMLGQSTAEGIREDQVEPLLKEGGVSKVLEALRGKVAELKK